MRILLSKRSKEKLFEYLIRLNNCHSLMELSSKIKIPLKTIQNWKYIDSRYIPEKIIPPEIKNNLEILDRQDDDWGKIKGGKETYNIILKKYGKEELHRRQVNGGKKSRRVYLEEDFAIDLKNHLFLEFYGILLGDGWISKLNYKNKVINLIGISGHYRLDREFFMYLKSNIKVLFDRKAYLKERPKQNSIELNFTHKSLLNYLNKTLGFPIGKKVDLMISDRIYSLDFDYIKYVFRGIFDTDGSFYFDKSPNGNKYPCLNITLKSPILINQIYRALINEGFKVQLNKSRYPNQQIVLKGSIQLNKWMKLIGSSNKKHLDKINALVAQSG
jgi:hypothetical protein